jgi:ABC-2 type transport system permease protein
MQSGALTAIYTIWLRELNVFRREKARVAGMLGQPLFYLLIMGQGIGSSMSLNNAPGGIDYVRFMYPGVIGMSLLFTSIFSALSIIWDREFGFLKEVLVAPVPRWAVAVGKIAGGSTVAMIQSLILIALAPLMGIQLSFAMLGWLMLLALLISVGICGLGVAIAARMESMQGFQMLLNFLIMPMYFLSGAMFPLNMAPGWMRALMVVDPLTYGTDALRTVCFYGVDVNVNGQLIPAVAIAYKTGLISWSLPIDLVILAFTAVALSALAAWRFNGTE